MTKTVFSAMRPTGRLHLGHLVGALENWIEFQDQYRCVYSIVDWHALMGEYEQSQSIADNILEMAADWLACGIDPKKSIIFIQSHVPEHLELQMILSCITPLGWLERNPTYKEQLREITKRDLQTYAFLGYPVLQAADILLYKADKVPIGEDQLPHLELTREISRRFNFIYKKEFFKDCEALLTETPRLLGLDGRKMSKSYDNAINLSDSAEDVQNKVKTMFTDPARQRLSDPGNPDVCNVFSYYKEFAADLTDDARQWCTKAEKGCTQCKALLAERLNTSLGPVYEKRQELIKDKDRIMDILLDGAKQARAIAQETMAEIRQLIF